MNLPKIVASVLAICAFSAQAGNAPLKILIVNDDGCESPGSTSLQDKLKAKGYDVWMVAPATNQSGIGSAITFKTGKVFDVKKVAEQRYCFHKYWPDSVDYVVSVVDKLNAQRTQGKPLLPLGTGLSINYPALATTEIKGVHYVENQRFPVAQIGYDILADGKARQTMNPESLKVVMDDTDSGWLNKGYITYTIFDGSWNAPQYEAQYQALLKP